MKKKTARKKKPVQTSFIEQESAYRFVENEMLDGNPINEQGMVGFTVRVDPEVNHQLESLARHLGVSKSKLVGKCITFGAHQVQDAIIEFNDNHPEQAKAGGRS